MTDLSKNNKKLDINFQKYKILQGCKEIENKELYMERSLPMDVVFEWDLIYTIFDYCEISFSQSMYYPQDIVVKTEDVEKHYYFLNKPELWDNEIYRYEESSESDEGVEGVEGVEGIKGKVKNKKFYKRYGRNGLHEFLELSDGVSYNIKDKEWLLTEDFFDKMYEYYKETQQEYGKDFLKFIM